MKHMLFVFAICFAITVNGESFTLDVDGDGEATPLTDGLLIIRHQFGFNGDSLINGAVSEGSFSFEGGTGSEGISVSRMFVGQRLQSLRSKTLLISCNPKTYLP